MPIFDCLGVFVNTDGSQQQVKVISDRGSLLIRTVPSETQMVYLPAGSMDTILIWGRETNENLQLGSLDLDNPETQIKVTFYLNLKDLVELKQQLRGKQVFYKQNNYKPIAQIAPSIQLIQTDNDILIEKVATFPQSIQDTIAISRLGQLKQEADILNLLKEHPHKNIINMEEITTDYSSVSILLENCEGGDLLKILNQKNITLDIPVVMDSLLSGLDHLHSMNIVHRDIKLQNIFFNDARNARTLKIADFGLSCLKQQIPFYNPRCGTPGYTAPEVFGQPCKYDEKVDIYSAGIIFYNLLTKKNPFGNSRNIQDIIKQNITGAYEQSHLSMTKMNDPLAYDLLTKMLQKDSKLRPSAIECLKHPYFQQQEIETIDEMKETTQVVKSSKVTKRVKV